MSSGDVDVDQLVERTDTGVSTTSMLKRGTGTRDEDKHGVKAKAPTFADAVAKLKAALNYIEGELLDRARTIQPPGDDGGGEPCPRRPPRGVPRRRRAARGVAARRVTRRASRRRRSLPPVLGPADCRRDRGRRERRTTKLCRRKTPTLPARTHRPPWTTLTPRTECGPNSTRPSTSGSRPISPSSSLGAPRAPPTRGRSRR